MLLVRRGGQDGAIESAPMSRTSRTIRPDKETASALAMLSTQIVRAPTSRPKMIPKTPGAAPVEMTTSGRRRMTRTEHFKGRSDQLQGLVPVRIGDDEQVAARYVYRVRRVRSSCRSRIASRMLVQAASAVASGHHRTRLPGRACFPSHSTPGSGAPQVEWRACHWVPA